MKKIVFVCHGNICRSPMAEYLFKNMANSNFIIDSRATSDEAIGMSVHRETKKILSRFNINCDSKKAQQLTKKDYDCYDLIIGMDEWNIRNILNIVGCDYQNKVHLLLEYAGEKRNIEDPWYTHDFEKTFEDINKGCEGLLQFLK